MDTAASQPPDAALAELAELTTLGLRTARVVAHLLDIEQAAADLVAAGLPTPGTTPATLAEAAAIGQSIDAVHEAMAQAVPRAEILSRAFDRLSRAVRRTVALTCRIQSGWPRPRAADDRPAMLRRQVAHGVTKRIRREADDEAAERLFDDLYERLDDPIIAEALLTLPVEEVVRRICRDLGLATSALTKLAAQPPNPGDPPPHAFHPRESG